MRLHEKRATDSPRTTSTSTRLDSTRLDAITNSTLQKAAAEVTTVAAPQPRVYVVGNKIDMDHLRKVSESDHATFIKKERLAGGFFTSAQSGEQVQRT